MINAPWTLEQVRNLVARQNCSVMHSYTCGKCSENQGCTDLEPRTEGWWCPVCRILVQDWAHDSDVNGDFRRLVIFREDLNKEIDG